MKKTRISIFAVAALTALLAAPVIAGNQTGLTPDSTEIAQRLRKQIVMLPNYGVFDHIQFQIEDGTVTLLGQASRPTLKQSVERVALKIKGVTAVVNEIEVLPNSRYDEQVRGEAYARIYGHSVLDRYDPGRGVPRFPSTTRRVFGPSADPPMGSHAIHIIVKNGVVTLEGVVTNESEKHVAGIQASSVSGAFQVINNIRVATS